ncbi:MAG: succinylglutamate desuccinylase/aspartoacylase family protein [Oscillospiraceae bacterium]
MKIGNIEAKKGKLTKGYLEIGYASDGEPVKIPVIIVNGVEDGEVYWVEGGIHGTEISGAMAIIECLNSIDPEKLKGTVVGVPVVNIMAHCAGHHHSPVDYTNLNHVFPGNPDGSYTQQLAYEYYNIVTQHANYLLDFHNGGHDLEMPYYCGYIVQDGTETAEKTKKLVEFSGADAGWVTHFAEFRPGLPSQLASMAKAGIASMIVESGSADCTEDCIGNYKKSILGGLRGFGFIEGEPYNNPKQLTLVNGKTPTGPKTHKGGLFISATYPGAILNEGDQIGKVINLFGDVVEDIKCPEDNMYVTSIMRTGTPVATGTMYGELAMLEE